MYSAALKGIDELILPQVHQSATHVYHLFVIRTRWRDQLQGFLKEIGIGTLIHYPVAVHLQPAYAYLDYKKGSFPIAEEIADSCLSLPMWPGMNDWHVDQVCRAIKKFFSGTFL
jgi:dTDP-4-amino-4,6-dideoxygalactose transaminase